MESSSNFDKLLMWTCTNEQLVSYIDDTASYLIVYSIAIPILFLFALDKQRMLAS